MRIRLTILMLSCLALGGSLARAAQFTVDSTGDAADAAAGDGHCATASGTCTLRAAIDEANALAGDDVITLPAGTYPAPTDDPSRTAGFPITGNLVVEGAGAVGTVVDGVGHATVVRVDAGAVVSFRRLTVAHGQAKLAPGGIWNRGTLDLTDCIVRDNGAAGSDVVAGLRNDGMLTLTRTTVAGNGGTVIPGGSGAAAGALRNENGATAVIVDSIFRGNAGVVGGIRNGRGATLTVTGSAFVDNDYDAILTYGTLVMTNSTVSGNQIGDAAISCQSPDTGSIVLANVTITGNAGASGGAGIGGSSCLSITLRNTVVAGNVDSRNGELVDCGGATIVSQGYNLIGRNNGCTIQGDTTGNLTALDPLLGPLTDNGGPTPTHAPLPGSPLIDAGNPAAAGSGGAACAATDQRGVARPLPTGGRCDIGAHEAGGPAPPPPTPRRFVVDDTGMTGDEYPGDGACRTATGTCTLRAAMQEGGARPGAVTIELDAATYTLDRIDHEDIRGISVLPSIAGELTVVGKGPDATTLARVSAIQYPGQSIARSVFGALFLPAVPGHRLTLRGLTITGPATGHDSILYAVSSQLGAVTVEDCVFAGNAGGDIHVLYAPLTLRGSTFRRNVVNWVTTDPLPPDCVFVVGGLDAEGCTFEENTGQTVLTGGGIGKAVRLVDSVVRGNVSVGNFPGVRLNAVTAGATEVLDCRFDHNIADQGALSMGRVGTEPGTIRRSTFTGNQDRGGEGGGALQVLGDLAISDSTFSGNTSVQHGGAVDVVGGALTIVNSTFSGNVANRDGGAIYVNGSALGLRNVTLTGNRSVEGRGGALALTESPAPLTQDIATIRHVLLAGNHDAHGDAPDCLASARVFLPPNVRVLRSFGYNLIADGTGCQFEAQLGDQVGTAAAPIDPRLAALADNGGTTLTHALLPGSPAIDAGDPSGCSDAGGRPLTTDQRGFTRPIDGDLDGTFRCDLGAFEAGSTSTPSTMTTTTIVTTTTVPVLESCGNCIDDDRNGLTDFEDPACCGENGAAGLIVKRVRVKPKAGKHVFTLAATLTNGDVDFTQRDLFVQLRQAGTGEVLCAEVPGARFVRKGTGFRFADKPHAVASAAGIDAARVKLRRDRSAKLGVKGTRVTLAGPSAGGMRVTIGVRDATAAHAECAGADGTFTANKKGALRYP